MTEVEDLRKLARLMDSRFEGPFGIKFGLDALVGLIPVLGDLSTVLISAFIIIRCATLGCPPVVLFRMVINVAVENFVNPLPFIGNLFDFYWKSNDMNIVLLEHWLARPEASLRRSRIVLGLTMAILFACFMALILIPLVITVLVLKFIFSGLQ